MFQTVRAEKVDENNGVKLNQLRQFTYMHLKGLLTQRKYDCFLCFLKLKFAEAESFFIF